MSGNRGCIANSLLFLVCVFVPILGHLIETVWVFEDDHSPAGTIVWLLIIWSTPIIGPLIYLLFGQRRRHVMFGRPSYAYNQQRY